MIKCTVIVNRIYFAVLVVSGLIFSQSCRPSQIYNPSLNLPAQSLEKGDLILNANAILAPESRPHKLFDRTNVNPALSASAFIGLTNRFTLRAEGIIDLSNQYSLERGGVAFSMLVNLNQDKNDRISWVLIPKYGFAIESKIIEGGLQIPGHGFSLSLGGWVNTSSSKFKPYFGLSTLYGFTDWKHEKYNSDAVDELRIRNGFAFGIHSGLNYKVNNWINVSAELPIIYQYNHFEDQHYIIPTPSLGVSVDLKISKK